MLRKAKRVGQVRLIKAHVSKAARNYKAMKAVNGLGEFPEWEITILFYTALHVIDAMFASLAILHGPSHDARFARLRAERRFQKILFSYKELYDASRLARYMTDNRFSDTWPAKCIQTVAHDKYLLGIIKSTERLAGMKIYDIIVREQQQA